LTEKILSDLKRDVKNLKLIPSKGGCFEVWINQELVYSKLDTGEFPDDDQILDVARARVGSVA
jgi:selenoprotein W-related protein